MADAPLLSAQREDHVSGEPVSPSVPRSFSYRLDAGSDFLLGSRRSSYSSLFGSRRHSTDLLLDGRRGSVYGFGSTFVRVDDAGVYLSSLAVTVVLSALATLGILFFTVVVTLAILLGQCQDKPGAPDGPSQCASFALSAEVGNLREWTLPQDCIARAASYVDSGQYALDFTLAVDAARVFLRPATDGLSTVVVDLDDTLLSSLPLLRDHHFGADLFQPEVWDRYVTLAAMPPLQPMLSLYQELRALNWTVAVISDRAEAHRNATIRNLQNAGYEGYILILRSGPGTVEECKARARLELEAKGFRIRASIGDEWSDLRGPATGERIFKLPNSLYYT